MLCTCMLCVHICYAHMLFFLHVMMAACNFSQHCKKETIFSSSTTYMILLARMLNLSEKRTKRMDTLVTHTFLSLPCMHFSDRPIINRCAGGHHAFLTAVSRNTIQHTYKKVEIMALQVGAQRGKSQGLRAE